MCISSDIPHTKGIVNSWGGGGGGWRGGGGGGGGLNVWVELEIPGVRGWGILIKNPFCGEGGYLMEKLLLTHLQLLWGGTCSILDGRKFCTQQNTCQKICWTS